MHDTYMYAFQMHTCCIFLSIMHSLSFFFLHESSVLYYKLASSLLYSGSQVVQVVCILDSRQHSTKIRRRRTILYGWQSDTDKTYNTHVALLLSYSSCKLNHSRRFPLSCDPKKIPPFPKSSCSIFSVFILNFVSIRLGFTIFLLNFVNL